ncbi:transketolase [Amylibacter sp.]|jgi:predicted nuclease with TOPRIM domain|nr:transketolase [Amylibacter sp.]MDB9875787.1 transketolase [Amylibacter sp.]MDB9919450.1 transketolase [Amylibacter sp.]MDC1288439.1 transketolase [Amylibacter sp.]MDC1497731.1 transketolase [Amylibacter sp.]|tara:strand:- start:427 stop:759 length:333 start_codon:yes stop_codon:yes gene_type:complete
MTQIPDLKKDFEIAVIAIQDQIESLRKNKTLNEDLISKLENENSILKSRIEELEQTSIKNNEPELGFVNDTKSASLPFSNDDNEILKDLHKKDIEEVQNILNQLKDLVEE